MMWDLNWVCDIVIWYCMLVDDVLGDLVKYGLFVGDIICYCNVDEIKKGFDYNVCNDFWNFFLVYLFVYDLMVFGGKGWVVIVIGNFDIVKYIVVIVFGISSSVKGGWLYDNYDDVLNFFN